MYLRVIGEDESESILGEKELSLREAQIQFREAERAMERYRYAGDWRSEGFRLQERALIESKHVLNIVSTIIWKMEMEVKVQGCVQRAIVKNLLPGATYKLKVTVKNDLGESLDSKVIKYSTPSASGEVEEGEGAGYK